MPVERAREHRGRGGLAVRARYRERVRPLAQAREHLGTVDDVEVAAARFFELGVVVGLPSEMTTVTSSPSGAFCAWPMAGDAVSFSSCLVAALLDIEPGGDHALVMRPCAIPLMPTPPTPMKCKRSVLVVIDPPVGFPLFQRAYCSPWFVPKTRLSQHQPISPAASGNLLSRAAAVMPARKSSSSISENTSCANLSEPTSASGIISAHRCNIGAGVRESDDRLSHGGTARAKSQDGACRISAGEVAPARDTIASVAASPSRPCGSDTP